MRRSLILFFFLALVGGTSATKVWAARDCAKVCASACSTDTKRCTACYKRCQRQKHWW